MLIAFSVFDHKANSFNTPFFAPTQEVAQRSFVDLGRDERTTVAQHPEDFDLFVVGTFDSLRGFDPAGLSPCQIMSGMEARVLAHKANQLKSQLFEQAEDK